MFDKNPDLKRWFEMFINYGAIGVRAVDPLCDGKVIDKAKLLHSLEAYKECYKCGGLFKKDKMKIVEIAYPSMYDVSPENSYYCRNCKPHYDKIFCGEVTTYYKKIEAKEIKVDKNGKPLKEPK